MPGHTKKKKANKAREVFGGGILGRAVEKRENRGRDIMKEIRKTRGSKKT